MLRMIQWPRKLFTEDNLNPLEILLLLIAVGMAVKKYRLFDRAFMRGDVKVWLVDATGARTLAFEKKNLIVRNGKTIMAKLLGGDASYKNLEHISTIAFGTSSTAATDTQTNLIAQQFSKAATVDYPAYNQVRFSATMDAAEGGSYTYQELGLKSAATGILFSRIVIAAITKSTSYKIQVEWTISLQ